MGTLQEDQCAFLVISRSILLLMRNVSDKISGEYQNKHYIFIFFLENLIVYEIMWKDFVEPDKPKMKIWRLRSACCISEATNTLSESVILTVSLLEQSMHGRTSMSRYTYISGLVYLVTCKVSHSFKWLKLTDISLRGFD